MALTNTLAIRLELIAAQFEAQIARVNKLLDETGKAGKKAEDGVKKAGDGITDLVRQATRFVEQGPTLGNVFNTLITKVKNTNAVVALLAAGMVAAVAGMRRMFNNAVSLATELKTMSLRTGIAVDDLSRLRVAAALSNTSFHSVTRAISIFNRQVTEAASGSDEAQKRLKKVGIEGDALRRALNNPIEGLKLVGDKLAQLPTQAARAAKAQAAFGSQARLVIPLLGQEGKAIQALLDEADRLGVVLGPRFAERADEFENALKKINFLSEALAINFAEELLPPITDVLESFVELARNSLIKNFFAGLGQTIARVAISMSGLAKAAEIALKQLKISIRDFRSGIQDATRNALVRAIPILGRVPGGRGGGARGGSEAERAEIAGLQKELAGIAKRWAEVGQNKEEAGGHAVGDPIELDDERTALERLAKTMGEVLDKVTKGVDPVVTLARTFDQLAQDGVPGMDAALARLIARLDELSAKGDIAAKRARAVVEAQLVGPQRAEEVLSTADLEKRNIQVEAQLRELERQQNLTPEETLGFGEQATADLSAFADQLTRIRGIFGEIRDVSKATGETLNNFAGTFAGVLVSAAENGSKAFGEFFKGLLRQLARAIIRATILSAILSIIGVGGAGKFAKFLQTISKFLGPIGFQDTESSVLGRSGEARALGVGGGIEPALAGGANGDGGSRPIEVRVMNATPATYVEITDRHIIPRLDQRLRFMNERSLTRTRA